MGSRLLAELNRETHIGLRVAIKRGLNHFAVGDLRLVRKNILRTSTRIAALSLLLLFNQAASSAPSIVIEALIIPERKDADGILVRSTSAFWRQLAKELSGDWGKASQLTPTQWEEMVAGAYQREGYDVVLTPRSGDFGRDVIATSRGVGSVRILGSVKAYNPGHKVTAESVRSLLGVLSADQRASKGIITTTSEFAPRVEIDPLISPFLPTRLGLMDGKALQAWLNKLSAD